MKSNLVGFFTKMYDLLDRYRPAVLGATCILVVFSTVYLARVELDMSFNPFFSNDRIENMATDLLQEEFGTRLGAYIGVIIEREDTLSVAFLPALDSVSADVERLYHVSEVISLARMPIPDWHASGAGTTELFASGTGGDADSLWAEWGSSDIVRGVILSEDGRSTLLLARLDLPMSDAPGRAVVIADFETTVRSHLGDRAALRFIGYSVVEEIFAGIVLKSLAQTFALTFLTLVVILWIIYRRTALVGVALIGVCIATPVSIGLMVLIGQKLTMINSMVPVVIMIIGTADAIHMIQSFLAMRKRTTKSDAIRRMFGETGFACMLTTVTTAFGFLGLTIARITAIQDFGMNVAIGVVAVWIFNLIFVPTLLLWITDRRLEASEATTDRANRWAIASAGSVIRFRGPIVTGFVLLVVVSAFWIDRLDLNQFVNGEVTPDTPMRADQLTLERDFGGFLGPEISIARWYRQPFDWSHDLEKLRAFEEAVRALPDVDRVESVLDFIPDSLPPLLIRAGLADLRNSDRLGVRMRTLIDEFQTRVSIIVHVSDNGTKRAEALIARIREVARAELGMEYATRLYGGWFLAQTGMQNVSRDMLMSFATSMLLVLPILAFALGSLRLFFVSLVPNLLPMVFALAFSVWVGIPIRIGTAMVLAIAFGIAVDDTIHMMMRLKLEQRTGRGPVAAVMAATAHTGAAILYTSAVLIAGFLTMLANDLLAIQDMGILASGTLFVAFLSDVYLAPALFLMTSRESEHGVRDSEVKDHARLRRAKPRLSRPLEDGHAAAALWHVPTEQ